MAKQKKKTFIMQEDWIVYEEALPDELAIQFQRAINNYQLGKEFTITDTGVKAYFESIVLPAMKNNDESYQEKVDNAKASVEKRKNNIANNRNKSQANKSDSQDDASDTVYVDVDDYVSPNGDSSTSAKADVRDTRVSQSEIKEITFAWNSLPEPVPRIQKLAEGSSRMKSLKARIKQYSTADVLTAIDNVRRSPFLLGQVKDFVITFDWFVKPTNFPKVLDGNYLDRNVETARSGTTEENVDAEYEKRFEETMREEGLIT